MKKLQDKIKMKKVCLILLLILTINKTYSQSFDTLNIIDNLSKYITFLESASTLKVSKVFRESKYLDHIIKEKGYAQFSMNDEYYRKYRITQVDFPSYCEIDSIKDYLVSFAFYSPISDTAFIFDKLICNGWKKEKSSNDLKVQFINENYYRLDNQTYNDIVRYYIFINGGDEFEQKQKNKELEYENRIALMNRLKDSIANAIPIDTIKGVFYAKTEDEIPSNYNGVWEFHKAGKLIQRANYKNGLLNGEYITYFKNGLPSNISNYKNGKLNGKWILYYDNGQKAGIRTYNNDIIIDSLFLYYDNGKIMGQSFYKNGEESGLSKMYYQSGKLKNIINHSNNNLAYYSISYWENGIVSKKYFYNDSLSLFQEITFTEKGKILGKGCYKNGIKDGVWLEYNEEGNISRKITYKNGRSEEEIEDGILVEEENGDSYIIKHQ